MLPEIVNVEPEQANMAPAINAVFDMKLLLMTLSMLKAPRKMAPP